MAKNGKQQLTQNEEVVITPNVIIDTTGVQWQPMTQTPMESIEPEIMPSNEPTSSVNTGGGLALYNPDLEHLQNLLDAVEAAEEESELEVLILEQNDQTLTQEIEVLTTVQQKIQTIRSNKAKAKAGSAKVNAKQRLAEMLKKQIGENGSL